MIGAELELERLGERAAELVARALLGIGDADAIRRGGGQERRQPDRVTRAAPVRLTEQREVALVRPRIEVVAAAREIGLDLDVTRDLAAEHGHAERETHAAHRIARGGARIDARAPGGHEQLLAPERPAFDADETKRGKSVKLD